MQLSKHGETMEWIKGGRKGWQLVLDKYLYVDLLSKIIFIYIFIIMSMRFQQTSFKSLDKRLVHIRPWLQDRRKLLRDWVQTNGDASQIEADILLSKSNSSRFGKKRELLTVGEMVAKG